MAALEKPNELAHDLRKMFGKGPVPTVLSLKRSWNASECRTPRQISNLSKMSVCYVVSMTAGFVSSLSYEIMIGAGKGRAYVHTA